MMAAAIGKIITRLESAGVPRPTFSMDGERGAVAGRLTFDPEGTADETARTLLSYLFSLAREGRLPPGVEQGAVNVLLPMFTLACPGSRQLRDGLPICTVRVSMPRECPACHRRIGG
jgi:hypothetical protein